MAWSKPIPLSIVADPDPDGFSRHPEGTTGLPVGPDHPGAFGHVRRNHVHEGVDLYCPEGTPVHAVEDGVVVAVIDFTGTAAEPPSPWWRDTQAVLVEGETGVVVYGEIAPGADIRVGVRFDAGDAIGRVVQVLAKDKGRPMTMLHLELHRHGTRDAYEWTEGGGAPESLRDPTPHLMEAIS